MANTKVQSEQIEDGSITADKLADGTIVAAELADNAVVTAAINADAVTGAKIADNAIDSEHYTDGSIDTAHIADAQITVAKMAANSVDSDQYVDGSIDTVHIADAQVTTAKIANGNISTAKIADNAVTSAKIDTNIDIAGTFDVTGATTLDSTLAVVGLTTLSGDLTLASTTANKPVLTLTDTNADSQAPDLVFRKDSSSPADGDELFRIYGYGDDSAGNATEGFLMLATMTDVTDGTEDSKVRFMTYGTGSQQDSLTLAGTTAYINNSSPFAAGAAILHLHQPDVNSNGYLHLTHQDTGATASDGMSIGLLDNGEDAVIRLRENGDLRFWTNNTNHMTLQSDGKLAVTEIRHISAGNLEIGNDDEKHIMHSDGYHQFQVADTERLRITSNGVTFNGDTAAANSLNDYEEGNWTPTIYGASTTGSASGNIYGKYVKIGDLVFASFSAANITVSNASGHLTIGGFPFNNSGTGDREACGLMRVYGVDMGSMSSYGSPVPGMANNNNYAFVVQSGDDTSWNVVQISNDSGQYIEGQITYIAT